MSLFHLWKFHSMALIAGCILDWLMGDPYWLFHPVRFMGNMISALEARLRRLFPEHLLLAGGVLAGFMCLFWTLIPVLGFFGDIQRSSVLWHSETLDLYLPVCSGKHFLRTASGGPKLTD